MTNQKHLFKLILKPITKFKKKFQKLDIKYFFDVQDVGRNMYLY